VQLSADAAQLRVTSLKALLQYPLALRTRLGGLRSRSPASLRLGQAGRDNAELSFQLCAHTIDSA
jgi:hypothetical protein